MTNKNQKGFSLVELLVVVIIIGIIAAIAIPSLLASRKAANEAAAVANLRTIHSAQVTYLGTAGGGTNFTTIALLSSGGLLDGSFSGGSGVIKSGYKFLEQASPTTTYCVHADQQGGAGNKNFGVGTDGTIYYDNTPATPLGCAAGAVTGGTVLGS